MKRKPVGQGDQVNVHMEVNGHAICTVVFGAESGHPFSGCWDGTSAKVNASATAVFGACALLSSHLLSDANFDALLEFLVQLGDEEDERKGAAESSDPDDDVSSIPF